MSTTKPPLTAESLMTWPLAITADGATLRQAATEMATQEVGALIVHGARGLPIGLVTERDLARGLADGADPDTAVVADIMVTDLVQVDIADSARTAADQMLQAGTRHLPVSREGRIEGMISMRDLLGALLPG